MTKNFIHFRNISFKYEGSNDNVIERLNLEIPRGQKVGIVGHSGAGKSTLVNLLLKNFAISNYEHWDRPADYSDADYNCDEDCLGDESVESEEYDGSDVVGVGPLPVGEGAGEGFIAFTNKVFIKEAKELRKNQTPQEKIIWDVIRNNNLGFKFRRKHAIYNKYIVDFICLELRLVIEIHKSQSLEDKIYKEKKQYLTKQGYKILEFYNKDIEDNLIDCISNIKKALTPTLSRRERVQPPHNNKLNDKSGDILINNQSIYDVSSDSLRSHISLIPQDIMLFYRTIAENIGYAKENATQEEVENASKMAMMHNFITNLPEGYNTLVGERGVKLSGGQRQRIAIARAILKNAPILILDEATSSLDSETENEIQKSINTMLLANNSTVIAIAHRLSTIKNMDRIIVMDGGKIVEDGSFNELIDKSGGKFKELWQNQVNGMVV